MRRRNQKISQILKNQENQHKFDACILALSYRLTSSTFASNDVLMCANWRISISSMRFPSWMRFSLSLNFSFLVFFCRFYCIGYIKLIVIKSDAYASKPSSSPFPFPSTLLKRRTFVIFVDCFYQMEHAVCCPHTNTCTHASQFAHIAHGIQHAKHTHIRAHNTF